MLIRMGKKHFTTSIDEDLLKDLRKLAIDKGCSANVLLEEGVQYILKKHQSQIAEPAAKYGLSSSGSPDQAGEQNNNQIKK